MPVYARLEPRLGRLGQSRGVPRSAEPPRHAAQRHAHSKHTPPTRCEPEDRTTHHQRAKLRRNGGLVSHLSFLPSLEKYFFPDHEVIPASYLGNLVESQPKQLFCYRALVNKGFFAGSSLTKRRMAHAQKRLSPMLRPVPSVRQIYFYRAHLDVAGSPSHIAARRTRRRRLRHFPLTCASLVFCRVCVLVSLYRPSSCVHRRAPPAQRRPPPIDSRWSPKIRARMPTASGIPTRSPITVLTRPGEA